MNKNNHENKLDVQKNLDTLLDILKSIEHLEHTIHVLNFDMETICPKEGMDDMVRDITIYQGKIFECKGTMSRGKSVQFRLFNGKLKSTKPTNLKTLHHANIWQISLIEQNSNNFIRNAKL